MQSSHLASDMDSFPVIQRAILKHNPNLIVLSIADLSDENLENVKSEFKNSAISQEKYYPLEASHGVKTARSGLQMV